MHIPPASSFRLPASDAVVAALARVLADNLLGVYLHGSLAFGCFNPQRSDIDLLAVTRRPMSPAEKRAVAASLLDISAHPYPVEISILAREHLHPWRYPTPFDFHYSEDWRAETFAALADGAWQSWTASQWGDPDLAAHITVLHARGVVLLGPPIAETFPPVPRADFIDSLRLDVLDPQFGLTGLAGHPVYSVLNACRTLAYFRTGGVLSKAEGGAWAQAALPAAHRRVIADVLAVYECGSMADEAALLTPELTATAAYLHDELAREFGAAQPAQRPRRQLNMEALDALLTRRSVRTYTDEPVADATIHDLLRAAMHAPSACNQQPWHFVVVRERDQLNAVAGVLPFGKMILHAPLAIVVCADLKAEVCRGYWVQDCAAATENLLLAAHAAGLGAVWIGVYPIEDRVAALRGVLGIPEHVVPLCTVAIGHPAETPPRADRYRADRVHQERW